MVIETRSYEYECRGAVSLNNMALLLLEKRAYGQAHEILKSSLSIVAIVTRAQAEGPEISQAERSDITDHLDRASQTMAHPQVSSVHASLSSLQQVTPATAVPIRIEANDVDINDTDLLCAVLTYNLAMSYLVQVQTNPTRSKELMEMAAKLFKVSTSILSLVEDLSMYPKIIAVAVAQLKALVALLHELGDESEVYFYMQTLSEMSSVAAGCVEDEQFYGQSDLIASAA